MFLLCLHVCLSALSSAFRSTLSLSVWFFLFHPIFPLLLFSLDPSSIRSSLCLSMSFSKKLTLFIFASPTIFSLSFCSVYLPPPIPSLSLSHYFTHSPSSNSNPIYGKEVNGEADRIYSSQRLFLGCLVTRTLHLYLILPSASTTHLNNWIIIEAQDALNERVVLLMALTLLLKHPTGLRFPFQLLVNLMWTAVQNLLYFCNVSYFKVKQDIE